MKRRFIGSVAAHVFLVDTEEPGRFEMQVNPIVHASESPDLRILARALREIAANLDEQASPLILPPSARAH